LPADLLALQRTKIGPRAWVGGGYYYYTDEEAQFILDLHGRGIIPHAEDVWADIVETKSRGPDPYGLRHFHFDPGWTIPNANR
jgi:hypothetical protein